MLLSKDSVKRDYDLNFMTYWDKVFSEYKNSAASNRVWFAGPTSYVFSLCGQKFALDLQVRRKCDFENVRERLINDTSDLSFVLITHQHDDHMCIPLMRELKDSPIRWYLPYDTKKSLIDETELPDDKIVKVHDGDVYKIGNLTVRVFFSPHVVPGDEPFPQVGYEVISPAGNILFPGDVRDYDHKGYPEFGNVDVCFSHLWGGDNTIDPELYTPMLEKFADMNAGFGAKKYFLCHLYEIGRELKYMWRYSHAGLAMDLFYERNPESEVVIPHLGCSYPLF